MQHFFRERGICYSIFIIFILLFLAGCVSNSSKIVTNDKFTNVAPDKAYIILGQKILDGNIKRISVALFCNDKIIKSKGIQLAGAEFSGQQYGGKQHNEFIIADSDNHGYTVWEIPIEKSSMTKCLLFIQSVSSGKTHFVPTVGPLSKYAFRRGTNFIPIKSETSDSFLGSRFEIEAPGIYYLGEIMISADLGHTKKHKWDGAYVMKDLTFKINKTSDLDNAKSYLSDTQKDKIVINDLSGAWKQILFKNLLN